MHASRIKSRIFLTKASVTSETISRESCNCAPEIKRQSYGLAVCIIWIPMMLPKRIHQAVATITAACSHGRRGVVAHNLFVEFPHPLGPIMPPLKRRVQHCALALAAAGRPGRPTAAAT